MKNTLESKGLDTQLRILLVAERLYAEIGFEKTTVADISRDLRMSPANVYRFFSSKASINEAVARRLLCKMESCAEDAVRQSLPAPEKLRAFLAAIEKANADRFLANPKLHDLVETAFNENWPVANDHVEKLTKVLTEIVSQGDREGDFQVGDCDLAAILVRSACIRFHHPRLMVECAQEPEPTLDQMVDFCLAALTKGVSTKKAAAPGPAPRLNIAAAG
jgi:AcrR family transcriptional regulator